MKWFLQPAAEGNTEQLDLGQCHRLWSQQCLCYFKYCVVNTDNNNKNDNNNNDNNSNNTNNYKHTEADRNSAM